MAISDLKKIYEDAPSKKANQLLVKALLENKEYLLAKEYMLEQINDYQQSEADFKLMLKVFILNHNFIQAQIMINSVKDTELQQFFAHYFSNEEAQYTNLESKKIDKIENDLYHIAGLNLIDQQKTLDEAMNIPVDNFVFGSTGALQDPFLNPAIRFNLLDLLRELQIKSTIKIKWLDKNEYKVDLSKLTPLVETNSAIGIFNSLETRFGNSTPDLFQNLIKTFNLFLAYLYPFNDQIIVHYQEWIEIAYEMQRGNRLNRSLLSEAQVIAYDWQNKLLKLIDSIK